MGALISLYALCEYPDVFAGAACLSTHWPGLFSMDNNPVPGAFFSYLKKSLPSPGKHRIYFDHGTETLDAMDRQGLEIIDIENLLGERRAHHVSFTGWEQIDTTEIGRGEPHGRPRVKFASFDELLAAAGTNKGE